MSVNPLWHQVLIEFDPSDAAEPIAIKELLPALADAETRGLISSWFFIRKTPQWRVRFLPAGEAAAPGAIVLVHQRLDTLHDTGRIVSWAETIYEPETHAFGGPAGMDVAHQLFHQDSCQILAYLGSDRATVPGRASDKRRELSILLCGIFMRAAGQDWYEQGDIWERVAEHRDPPPDVPQDRRDALAADLRRLLTADTACLLQDNAQLADAADWAMAFQTAGTQLGHLARNGTLRRGLRAVLAHHVIFAWNRLGLSHKTQSTLANAAKATVLDR